MVRTYQKTPGSKPYMNYKVEDMEKAMDAVRGGMSKKRAAESFKVPRPTLVRKMLGRNMKPVGHPTVLSKSEEQLISETLAIVANWGFPLTKADIRDVVKKYLDKQGKQVKVFKDNTPGPDFIDSFIARNNLSIRIASNIKRSRSSVNRDDIMNFFNNAEIALSSVKGVNLYNYDETNVTDDPGAKKVIVPRNTKRVERVQEHSRVSISIMVCGNANGDLLPPMVVYKAQNIYDNWTQGGPAGAKYASSPSGWFDMNLFEKWFFEILLPHVEATRDPEDTVVVLGDNLASHFSPKVIKACTEKKIYLTPFPPNATHLMQPLDVAVFAPMKKKWRDILDRWRKESRYPGCIPKEQFPVLLNRLWNEISANIGENLKSGFRATGLYPCNPNEVLKRIPDGLDETENRETCERVLDASLLELLKEHRGSGEKQKRKRGKRIQPGTDASVTVIATEAEAESPLTISEIPTGDIQAAVPQDQPSSSGIQTRHIQKKRPVRKTCIGKNKSLCGICRINREDDNGKIDWIQCLKCKYWICGGCNNGSKDPYYQCYRCEDSEEEDICDDSDQDKDFVPD